MRQSMPTPKTTVNSGMADKKQADWFGPVRVCVSVEPVGCNVLVMHFLYSLLPFPFFCSVLIQQYRDHCILLARYLAQDRSGKFR